MVFLTQKNRSFALWKRADFPIFSAFVAAPTLTRNCTIIMSSISDLPDEKIESPDRIADGNYGLAELKTAGVVKTYCREFTAANFYNRQIVVRVAVHNRSRLLLAVGQQNRIAGPVVRHHVFVG